MGTIVKKNNSFSKLDPGVYSAVVTAVEDAEGAHGDYLRWKFKIKDGLYEGEETESDVTATGNCPLDLFDGSKLDLWLKACGVEVEDGEDVDVDDAVGHKVMVTIEIKVKGEKTYTNAKDVNKMRKRRKPVEEDLDDDDEEDTPPKSSKSSKAAKLKAAKLAKAKAAKAAKAKAAAKKKKEEEEEEDEDLGDDIDDLDDDDLDDDLDDDDLDDDDLDDLTDLDD